MFHEAKGGEKMGSKANREIRTAMFEANVRQWQLADQLGKNETYVCRLLRKELPEERKREILDVIEKMSK